MSLVWWLVCDVWCVVCCAVFDACFFSGAHHIPTHVQVVYSRTLHTRMTMCRGSSARIMIHNAL